jgi:predicted HicB family RNase H-like nuclease
MPCNNRTRRDKRINGRFPPDVHEAALRAAAAERRNLTSFVEHVLAQHLTRAGFLPTTDRHRLEEPTA